MHVVHLTASPFFGGPERQMLGLAESLPPRFASTFLSFAEGGRCVPFLAEARRRGYPAQPLAFDTPLVPDAIRELVYLLRSRAADVLVTHTFKPNLLGGIAARRVGIPHVLVSRGWTGESWKVRLYEAADRSRLKDADRVVAVSAGQAAKVLRCGVDRARVVVIRNAVRQDVVTRDRSGPRDRLKAYFDEPIDSCVLAAGRLSPEKGFRYLVEAAPRIVSRHPRVGFLLFGEGAERAGLERRIVERGLAGRFRLPGFAADLDGLLPGADVAVLPSLTEGLPNVALEAASAGVPVVATHVGGVPEVVEDGRTGRLVPPAEPARLAEAVNALLADGGLRTQYGRAARDRVRTDFTFAAQARQYADLFDSLRPAARVAA